MQSQSIGGKEMLFWFILGFIVLSVIGRAVRVFDEEYARAIIKQRQLVKMKKEAYEDTPDKGQVNTPTVSKADKRIEREHNSIAKDKLWLDEVVGLLLFEPSIEAVTDPAKDENNQWFITVSYTNGDTITQYKENMTPHEIVEEIK